MDEDEVVKQLMSLLGNKKQLQLKSADGKMIKLSVDVFQDHSPIDTSLDYLEVQLGNAEQGKGRQGKRVEEDQEVRKFQKILQEAGNQNSIIPELITPIKSIEPPLSIIQPQNPKKISLSSKKPKTSNQAVLQFLDTNPKKPPEEQQPSPLCSSLLTTSETITGTPSIIKKETKDAIERIKYLKQNHPEDQEHLEIISQRMIQLEKMEQDKMKLDQEISSILSASFSNSISGLRIDSSLDASFLELSKLSVSGGINDPLCQIFNNYLRRTASNKKSNSEKMPSFLFLYSQPMLDSYGNEINEQINYFQEESIIQKALKECKIDYIKEQGTVEKFNYWLKQSISIIHFCGHGVPDYLLFEGPSGLSVKVDSTSLSKMLKQLESPLQLVFVASCHSESTGKIFKQAGATHVICIKDQYSILDEACHEFARIFYRSCINDKMSICDAFSFAKKQLVLSQKFNSHECSKFILIRDCDNNCNTKLNIAKQGDFRDLTFKPIYSKFIPSRVQNFIHRPLDLQQILKLIDSKNRFISVMGHSGIGKSTLVRQLVRYIQFRNRFKDGVIYLDIRSCEKMLKIFEVFTMQLFDSCASKLNKTFTENAQRIIKEIQEKEVLIVIDNCQNVMLSEDKNQFKRLIEVIMKNCDNVYFVFTNRSSIGRQIDYCSEKLYELSRLSPQQAETLFFLRAPRAIDKDQLKQFLKIGEVFDFAKHPFFQFLNGHPQAICMTASLLSDRTLCQLYQLLMKPSLKNQLPTQKSDQQSPGVNPLVQTAMKISLNVLKNKYKDSSEMIKTMSLLPVGADSEIMSKLFGAKWKETAKRLIDHSLLHCRQMCGMKYYTVHPYIIIYVESEIGQDEKIKLHEKVCEEYLKRIDKVYRHVGTLSQSSQKAQQQFFVEQENYKAIILRELSFYGQKSKIKRLYYNLFQADYSDDEIAQKQQQPQSQSQRRPQLGQATINKKRVYNQKILQPTKKDSATLLVVQFATILFVTKSPLCQEYIECGIMLSKMKNKLISQANLLRVKACISLIKNKYVEAKDGFLRSLELFAIEGCGLGSASCEAAVGYIRFMEQQYAPAKKNLQNALKYYDSIAHPFGKHYLNRWLCNLKTKMNRTQKQLISHRQQAQKLLKQTKILLRSSNINNTSLVKHKLGIFVFRFAFDNISLFLESSFQVDVRPRIINYNQVALKKNQKVVEEGGEDQVILGELNREAKAEKDKDKQGKQVREKSVKEKQVKETRDKDVKEVKQVKQIKCQGKGQGKLQKEIVETKIQTKFLKHSQSKNQKLSKASNPSQRKP